MNLGHSSRREGYCSWGMAEDEAITVGGGMALDDGVTVKLGAWH